jgi:hypothetical protein
MEYYYNAHGRGYLQKMEHGKETAGGRGKEPVVVI